MLFEDILIIIATGLGVFFVGIPAWKIVRLLVPKKRDPLQEARDRHEQARIALEVAKLDKATNDVIEDLYQEATENTHDEVHENKGGSHGR